MALSIEEKFVDIALSYVGCHYIWGGKGNLQFKGNGLVAHNLTEANDPTKALMVFDCSGLVTFSLFQATQGRVDLMGTHGASAMLDSFPFASGDEDGHLLLYPGHVAISIGRGRVVDAHRGGRLTTTILAAIQSNARVEAHRINRPESTLLGYRRIPLAVSELRK